MEYKDVTETIIGCAYRVDNKMGSEVQLVNDLVATGKPVGLILNEKTIMSILFILSKNS